MFNPLILVPKFRRILRGRRGGRLGLHSEWTIGPYELPDGSIRPAYTRGNITHDLGENALLQLIFGLQFTTFSWQILTHNAAYTHATKTLTGPGADDFAQYLSIDDVIYVVGGYDVGAVATPLTGSYGVVASNADDDTVTLDDAPTAGDGDLDGGVVIIRTHNFGIGLDARPSLAEADTTATCEAYEEDGTDYYRYVMDPLESKWTIAQNATSLDYEATSTQVTWTAGAADWQTNKNGFLVMGLADTDATSTRDITDSGVAGTDWSNDILLSSVAFDDPISLGNGQTLPLQVVWKLTEES